MNAFRRQVALASSLAAASCTAIVLYCFPPDQYSFYPKCPIHAFFGINCPGCGGTRALAALLHGQLTVALHDNALVVLLLPLALLYALLGVRGFLIGARWPQVSGATVYALAAVTAVFTVARNL